MKAETMKTKKEITQNNERDGEHFVYGYKALNENLCASAGNGMKFEVGKIYEATGKLKFCKNGFHFCKKLEDTLNYYSPSKNLRFIKVKAYGEVLSDSEGSKQLCRKIKVVKELSKKDVLKALRLNEDSSIKREILKKESIIKELLALKGLFLNTLINDEDCHVRRTVAGQNYGLDILVNDEDFLVRAAVAEQGYGLEVLIKDEDWYVRLVVAEQGYRLDILVNDKNCWVRAAVAKQGYGLDVLIKDENVYVRAAVHEYLANANAN